MAEWVTFILLLCPTMSEETRFQCVDQMLTCAEKTKKTQADLLKCYREFRQKPKKEGERG